MKKIFNSILVIAAAAAVFASCQKSEVVPSTTKTVNFTATTVDTKAAFGTPEGLTYPTLWTSNDEKVKVSLNYESAKDLNITPASDGKSATFSGEFKDDESGSYIFTAISPASAYVATTPKDETWTINILTSQKPSSTSVDEAAMILSAALATTDMTETIDLAFQHVTAYGVFNLTNLNLGGATINAVSLTAEKPIAGRFIYRHGNGECTESSGSNTITINTSATENIWFACAPCDLGGTTLKVVVNTDKGTFTKNATIPANAFKFEAGVIGKFNVDMTGIALVSPQIYTKVTAVDELTVGSKVIIVAAEEDSALSTTQNSNNRGKAGVTKSENKILDPSESVQILTLEKGVITNTLAFYTGEGYLYAAGGTGSNYMRTQENLDANGSFSATITEGVATLKARGTATRNWIRFNASSNGGIFSCYESGQGDVCLYKLEGSGTDEIIISETTPAPIPTFASLEELCAAELESGTEVTVTLTDEEIVEFYVSSKGYTNGVFLMVGDQKIEIYCNNVPSTWEIGGTISGTVTCQWKLYNGIWELCPGNWNDFTYTAPSSDEDDDTEDDDTKVLTFDLSANPGSWPTVNSTALTNYTYTLNGTDYSFGLKNVKCNSGYLMLTQPAVLGLPAIEGYKLIKIVAKNSSGCSTSVNVGVSSSASSADYISGGEAQKWATQSSSYTYTLSDTTTNTVYYLYVTSKNAQITELALTYEK